MFGEIGPKLPKFWQPYSSSMNYFGDGKPGAIYSHNNVIIGNNTNNILSVGVNDTNPGSNLSIIGNAQIGFTSGTAAPTSGLLVSGIVGIGTSSPSATIALTVNTTTAFGIELTGTLASSSSQVGIYANNTFSNTGSSTGNVAAIGVSSIFVSTGGGASITNVSCFYASPSYTGNTQTITNAIGFYFSGGGSTVGTIAHAYGVYAVSPSAGGTSCAIYGDNLSIGYGGTSPGNGNVIISGTLGVKDTSPGTTLSVVGNAQIGYSSGTTANSNSLIIAGSLGVQDTSPGTLFSVAGNAQIGFSAGTTGSTNGLVVSGSCGMGTNVCQANYNLTFYTKDSGAIYANTTLGLVATSYVDIYLANTIPYTSNVSSPIQGEINLSPTVNVGSGITVTNWANIYINQTTANSGTISNNYGILIGSGSSGSVTVTNSYGLYVAVPAFGTGVHTAYFDPGVGIGTSNATNAGGYIFGIAGNTTAIYSVDWRGSNTGTNAYGVGFNLGFTAAPTSSITQFSNQSIYPQVNCSGQTITTNIGLFIDTGHLTAGTVTNSYALYASQPAYGTNRFTAYFDPFVGIGTSPASDRVIAVGATLSSASSLYGIVLGPVFTASSGTVPASVGLYLGTNSIASGGATLSNVRGCYIYNQVGSNAGTITNATGLFIDTGSSGAGTISNSYGAYINTPAHGSNRYGMVISAADSAGASTGCRYMQLMNGTMVGDDGSNIVGLLIGPTQQPTNNNRYITGLYLENVAKTYSTNTVSGAYGTQSILYIDTSSGGVISNAYGFVVGINSNSGAPTTSTSIYCNMPATGTNKYGLWVTGSSTVATGNNLYGLLVNPTLGCSSGTLSTAFQAYFSGDFSGNTATISNAYTLNVGGGASAGTITTGYSVNIAMPTFGSTKIGMLITGSGTIASGNNIIGIENSPSLGCSSGTLSGAYIYYSYPNFSANSATITEAFGMFIDSGATGGTITVGYNLYVANPAYGTQKICASFGGTVQFQASATGSTTASLGTGNCPAGTGTAPYVWFKMLAPDGSIVYTPGWK